MFNDIVQVLFVEPEDGDKDLLQRILEEPREPFLYRVKPTIVLGSDAAITAVSQHTFDLILVNLPLKYEGDCGLIIVQQLVDMAETTKVIAHVHEADALLGIQAVQLGADDYMLCEATTDNCSINTIQQIFSLSQAPPTNESTLDLLSVQIITLDKAGKVISVNREWERLASLTTDLLIADVSVGDNYLQVCQRNGAYKAGAGIQDVLNQELPKFTYEYAHSDKHQTNDWFSLYVSPLLRRDGGAFVAHCNLAQRTALHAEAIRAKNLQDAFFNVTHDMRTPLTVMKLYLDFLDKKSAPELVKYIRLLSRQVGRLEAFIEDILFLARLEDSGTQMQFTAVDLNSLIASQVDQNKVNAQTSNLKLDFTPTEGELIVKGDEKELIRVVANLISNAIRYTLAGSIQMATFKDADTGRRGFVIRDTGIGIAPEEMPHLFERFYRSQKAQQMIISGTGLGLVIVQEIVTQHKGQIQVESQENEGTTFTIWFPYEVTKEGV